MDQEKTPMIQIVNQNTNTVNADSPNTKSWILALFLAFFFGYLGFDRFYLGHGGLGIIKLFTMGGFGILWVIDIFLIITKSVGGIKWK